MLALLTATALLAALLTTLAAGLLLLLTVLLLAALLVLVRILRILVHRKLHGIPAPRVKHAGRPNVPSRFRPTAHATLMPDR